ncbi:nitrogenase component 1 [Pelagicoccus sp. SDUM812003]|uniref:nitrogenase component 1 n=1 Tax=Pelagicoccus sp. SDUM812003 TaxID=3041267 RepID=UPI00281072B5|nr:nitrogenase component 1 [Pelagicoccus sp. SDUM812003]MDQ8203644.1 nitrogenase component 1 [Pelagicoccus sp. SDUM812003]
MISGMEHKNPDLFTVSGVRVQGAPPEAATRNACKLCSPLGAAMVFNGIRGCLPFLHGSQGCATYIRRYMISHFREPVDIASSSFTEDDAIFGGARNFENGVENVIAQYSPECVGVATTCLSETIGENMIGMIKDFQKNHADKGPPLIHVSTPAYTGTHSDGYYAAIREVVAAFAEPCKERDVTRVNILPAMMSCEDLRHLRELCTIYGLEATVLPDYSTRLEGSSWGEYNRIPPGGTSIDEIKSMGDAAATIEFGHLVANRIDSAGMLLEKRSGSRRHALGWPIGIKLSDQLFTSLAIVSGKRMPESIAFDRGRVVDAYVDAHKYVSGKKAVVYGEPDLVIGLASFLSEIGIRPVVCATGSKGKGWKDLIASEIEGGMEDVLALSGADHAKIAEAAREVKPDLLLGSSKGYPLARELNVPLVRIGFPIHDRFGGQRQLSVGYRGTLALFDRLVNAVMESKQEDSKTGYSYL